MILKTKCVKRNRYIDFVIGHFRLQNRVNSQQQQKSSSSTTLWGIRICLSSSMFLFFSCADAARWPSVELAGVSCWVFRWHWHIKTVCFGWGHKQFCWYLPCLVHGLSKYCDGVSSNECLPYKMCVFQWMAVARVSSGCCCCCCCTNSNRRNMRAFVALINNLYFRIKFSGFQRCFFFIFFLLLYYLSGVSVTDNTGWCSKFG